MREFAARSGGKVRAKSSGVFVVNGSADGRVSEVNGRLGPASSPRACSSQPVGRWNRRICILPPPHPRTLSSSFATDEVSSVNQSQRPEADAPIRAQ